MTTEGYSHLERSVKHLVRIFTDTPAMDRSSLLGYTRTVAAKGRGDANCSEMEGSSAEREPLRSVKLPNGKDSKTMDSPTKMMEPSTILLASGEMKRIQLPKLWPM